MKKPVVLMIHIAYWLCYFFLLLYIYNLLSQNALRGQPRVAEYFIKLATGFAVIPGGIGFYTFYGFLFTRFLHRKQIISLSLLAIAISYAATSIGGVILKILIGENLLFDDGVPVGLMLTLLMSVIPLVNGIFGLGMRGFITWYGDIKMKEELNRKNYETELALVKSQINPHFLFNTLNNIDVLIGLDPVKASAYLNKLSDIMRFMLYETKTEKVPISRELHYIEQYIDLQKIRSALPDYVTYTVSGDHNNILMEPMLFIPFIENAFKHANHHCSGNTIVINFNFLADRLIFSCENRYAKRTDNKTMDSGLGNELIQKRLQLIFGKQHQLQITDSNGVYQIKLTIEHYT